MPWIEKRYPCDCLDQQHFLVVSVDDDKEDPEFAGTSITVANGETSLWHRIKTAWKVILYGNGVFSEVYLDARRWNQFKADIAELPDLEVTEPKGASDSFKEELLSQRGD